MSAYIPAELQRVVRQRFGNCCAYCGTAEHLTATVFEFEHIVPRSAGGATSLDNLCLACPMCNRYKSDALSAIDPQTAAETRFFHPQQDRWIDHFAWNDGATEVVGLTPIGRATIAAFKMNRAAMIRVRRMWVDMGEHPPELD
jgi:hypothetical protein